MFWNKCCYKESPSYFDDFKIEKPVSYSGINVVSYLKNIEETDFRGKSDENIQRNKSI